MRSFVLLDLGLFAINLGITTASMVADLRVDTFDAFVNEREVTVVRFYTPWCPACKELEPVYDEAASRLDPSQDIEFAQVDCTVNEPLWKQFETPIYPTIRLFKGTTEVEVYNGPRELVDMIDFAERRFRSAVATLTNDKSIERFKRSNDVAVVAYGEPGNNGLEDIFAAVAKENLDYYSFGAADMEYMDDERVSQPAIVLYNNIDNTRTVYDGKIEADAITDWIDDTSIPLVGELDKKWMGRYVYKDAPPLVGLLADTSNDRLNLAAIVRPVAEAYKDRLRFATIDLTKSVAIASKVFNINDSHTVIAIIDHSRIFHMTENITISEDGINAWVKDFLYDNLAPIDVAASTSQDRMTANSILDSWKQGAAAKDEL